MTGLPASARPTSCLTRVTALALSAYTMALVEMAVRRSALTTLCRRFGVTFVGFEPSTAITGDSLPRGVLVRWWATEEVLRHWPWARERPCLRRSLALGHQLRTLSPVLRLEVLTIDPFVAHAYLEIKGNRVDTGDAANVVGLSSGAV